ncbi:MAG UNVERIFIED_CONTAM: hypothetical protein LOD86_12840 [Thermobifida fusca]
MPQDLHQVPPGAEVWEVEGRHFLVWYVPFTDPPVPLAWFVSSSEERKALGIDTKKIDRKFKSWDQFYATGVLRHGDTRELVNTRVHPWELLKQHYEQEVAIKPYLADPEILALWAAAMMEGREITEGELKTTNWWRTHSQAEREWLLLNASDPATAERLISDNRLRVADLLRSSGVANASEALINLIADNWTQGKWTEVYALQQIRLLADPYAEGELDPELRGMTKGLDRTREREDEVRQMIQRWLGPAYAANWTDQHIAEWAGRLRNDPDAKQELEDVLRKHRMALFPEYDNPNLTYEDIAAPWRGVVQQIWGQTADETDPLFMRIVRTNDLATAEQILRTEGLRRGIGTVVNDLVASATSAFGGGVQESHQAVM